MKISQQQKTPHKGILILLILNLREHEMGLFYQRNWIEYAYALLRRGLKYEERNKTKWIGKLNKNYNKNKNQH